MKPSITWYACSALRIDVAGIHIYVDPCSLPDAEPPADVLLVSHEHPHHLALDDIARVRRSTTTMIASHAAGEQIPPPVRALLPGEELTVGALRIQSVPAYTTTKLTASGKPSHPRASQGLGFILEIAERSFYIAGDTDPIPEMDEIGPVDYAILPIGGGTVMTASEAVEAVRRVRPSIAIPVHYRVDHTDEALRFAELVPDQVRVWILSPAGR